ncbi:MAG: M1 family metallopeptidase, partial [Verrucomicrobiales bacterium]|nr:M1 family metallopeptidase [Verrucomicrobiales bacterium]
TVIRVEWENAIVDAKTIRARGGYEYFEKDKNYIYEIAQWYPRLAAYTDVNGWQHKQFLGRGEFTLEFGDYRVAITVPDDHIVGSTGTLKNAGEVLSREQRERFKAAAESKEPVMIVNLEEATANEKKKGKGKRTWVFEAKNVRDFAWASSRKFLWDAMGVEVGGKTVMAMSYYPKEGEPLWSRYSTHSVAHTIEVYSKFTFDYPYPVAISVNGPVYGMEYPMICFNGPRPEEDGTYSKRTKYGLISVIIHEVGHNWFPMIVNSDERQWTWMDEGLNTFLQTLTEAEWEEDYPRRRGVPASIVGYMASGNQRPIMTNSESVLQFGNNAYGKPATALNILRETVMGRELFDFAFKEYSRRWMFKRPQPGDFFRSMEDASGVDLDWFWRGWFYTTKRVDVAIGGVRRYDLDARDPDVEKPKQKVERDEDLAKNVSRERDQKLRKYTDGRPDLLDFYNEYDELDVTEKDREGYEKLVEELEPWEKELLKSQRYFYVVELENVGGLVMPVILDVYYEDGSKERLRLAAEIWKSNGRSASKLILAKKAIAKLELDPQRETADTDVDNNYWPPRMREEGFQLKGDEDKSNPMRDAKEAAEKAATKAD